METGLLAHYHRALPLLTNNNSHQNPNNAPTRTRLRLQTRPFSAMKLTSRPDRLHQTLKRVCAYANNKNDSPFRYSRLSSSFDRTTTTTTTIVKRMATKTDQAAIKDNNDDNNNIKKEEEGEPKKLPSPPPPPEKPEPGDCCGSGCVRCVWDVYYEELEEYNKLYNNNNCDLNKSKSV